MKLARRDHKSLVHWAVDCAEHVLALFEKRHPCDHRPRFAVQAARAWERGDVSSAELREAVSAANAAAAEVGEAAARAAARAAGCAAAATQGPEEAHQAAAYAVTAAAFSARPEQAAAVTTRERNWQHQHLAQRLWRFGFPGLGSAEKARNFWDHISKQRAFGLSR